MQRKYIKREEWERNIRPGEQLTFSRRSPVASISPPAGLIGFACHGNVTVHDAQGTIYVVRVDADDDLPINIDAYSFDSRQVRDEAPISNCPAQEYHHTDWLPEFMKPDAPNWLVERAREMLAGLYG